MALVARVQIQMGHESVAAHPDLDNDWCKSILGKPDIQWVKGDYPGVPTGGVTNSFFEWTLYSERGIRTHLTFRRRCSEPDSITSMEECYLISVGDALDGKKGRAHGGLSSSLLDHICGHAAHYVNETPIPASPATATMTVDYKRPLNTPCLILVRGWAIEFTGRKVWVKAVIENENGEVYATGKTLFIWPKDVKL